MHSPVIDLESHITSPFNNFMLPLFHGCGVVSDEYGEHAVKISFTVDRHEQILDVAFRAYGERVLTGCASYVTELIRGMPLSSVVQITPYQVGRALKPSAATAWCTNMVVCALLAAVVDYRSKPPAFLDRPFFTRRRRRPPDPTHDLTVDDLAFLQPGETLDELIARREWILRCLTNLDLVWLVNPELAAYFTEFDLEDEDD